MGLSHLCDALLANLSNVSQGRTVPPASERKFRDIFNNMEAWLPIGTSNQPKPYVPDQYMPTLSPDRVLEVIEPQMAAVWSELDANWTQALVSR